MITRILLASLITALITTAPGLADDGPKSRDDWQTHFNQHDAVGTILIVDHRGEEPTTWVYDEERASTPYPPASTYKIPHALFGLEAGVVRDEFQVFEWDGVERSYAPWNRDQTLRSSMRYSTIWVYKRIAAELGEDKARAYLEAADYGNADPTPAAESPGNQEPYWVTGKIRITATQQVAFLEKLYRNELPFEVRHQRLVKDIMINEAGRDWVLRAKTGWTGQLGWWVGWVEHADGPVFFALNIDTPNRYDDLYKREAITRDVLKSIGALADRGITAHFVYPLLMSYTYTIEPELSPTEFIDVLRRSTLAERRPVDDPGAIAGMLEHADIILTARTDSGALVGVSRAITDYSYCTYLSDLAVDKDYQKQGIGRELIRRTHDAAGLNTSLILLSAPNAMNYYPHVGMAKHEGVFCDPARTRTTARISPIQWE